MKVLILLCFALCPVVHVAGAPLFGAKVDGARDPVPAMQSFNAWMGRPLQLLIVFTSDEHWSNASGEFIAIGYYRPAWAQAGVPVVPNIPLCPDDTSTTNRLREEVIPGHRDAEFRRAAQALANFRPQDPALYLRLGHEMNGSWYSWGQKTIAGVKNANGVTHADFIGAWRRVAGIFRSVSERFRFVWCVSARFGTEAHAEAFYPGNDWVDVISLDAYWDLANGTAAQYFVNLRDGAVGLKWHAAFAKARGKPIAFDEWGAATNGGAFVDGMAAWIEAQQPLWHAYWDSDAGYRAKISDGLSGTTGAQFRLRFTPPGKPGALGTAVRP